MRSLLESRLTQEQHELVKQVLIAQTEASGFVEAPVVEDLLRRGGCCDVLDVGCGEGSFLFQVAERVQGAQFLGIDHNELAVAGARARLAETGAPPNVEIEIGFFDESFNRKKYDAIMTRYMLQHCSTPDAFIASVFERLKINGRFIAVESLDDFSDCHERDHVWERFRMSLRMIHERAGSNDSIGKSLGRLFHRAGFKQIQVRALFCSPSTVGWRRFQAVIRATARSAHGLYPDLLDRQFVEEVERWLVDREELERKDPYLCTAVANGVRC